jgi:Ca2+-dependent lipid-binding protein
VGKSDPYLRIYMLPGRHMELKTKTKANTLNPVYNETFSFTVGCQTQILTQESPVLFGLFE